MKRNIEERLHNLSYDSVRIVAENFELDKETKSRIYAKTIRRTKIKPKLSVVPVKAEQKTPHRKLKFKKPAVAVVAIALALTVGVGSIVGAGALNKTFSQYFHTLPETSYKDMLFDINQTKTDNGVTVTLTQGMCDGLALYVIEKVEFDPSVLVLTDEMFKTNEYGGYDNAPRWDYSTLINVKQTSEYDLADIGGIIEREQGFARLLEHDEHSMTWLRVFGGENMGQEDEFFTDGTKFTVRYSGMDNMPGIDEMDQYSCSLDLTFDITKISEPVYYTLPEEAYSFTEAMDDSFADMIITPWYMSFSAGVITGKILDTSLNTGGIPAIEITMNDGTVYTESDGISMYQDYFGEKYDAYDSFRCDFDTPVDITAVKSIKIYAFEMKKGIVTADESKVRAYDGSADMQILPANSPVEFSDKPTTIDYRVFDDLPSYGQFEYKINGVTVYDNVYATGATVPDDLSYEGIRFWEWDEKTGKLRDGWYMLEYEIEMTNINANFSESLSTFDFNNTGCFEQLFDLYYYNKNIPSNWNCSDEAYIRENQYALTGQRETIKLNIGETKTFHVSFVVQDNKAGGFEQIGLCVGHDDSDGKIEYVNITKIIEEFNNSK